MSNRRTTPNEKLGMCIRMLASERDGEVVAAARALVRTLESVGQDIHALAERMEKPNGSSLTDAEMRKLYDAGYEAGVQAVESKYHGSGDFHNADGTPSWHEIATFCQRHDDRLRGNELQFVHDMASRTVWREPAERQAKWLRSIFHRLGGRI